MEENLGGDLKGRRLFMLSKARRSIATGSKNLARLVNHELSLRHGTKAKLRIDFEYIDATDWCMKSLHVISDSHRSTSN